MDAIVDATRICHCYQVRRIFQSLGFFSSGIPTGCSLQVHDHQTENQMGKKRINSSGTVYYVSSENRWRGQYYDAAGTRRSVSARTRKLAEQKLATAVAARDSNTLGRRTSDAGSVQSSVQDWLDATRHKWQYKTLQTHESLAQRYVYPYLGNRRIASLEPEVIERAYGRMRADHDLSNGTIIRIHAVLSGALSRAVRLRHIVTNPLDSVDLPRQSKNIGVALSEDQVGLLIRQSPEHGRWLCAFVHIALLYGLRQGEILGLRWEDLDFSTGKEFIHQQLQRQTGNGLVLKPLKGDSEKDRSHSRTIEFGQVTLLALAEWQA